MRNQPTRTNDMPTWVYQLEEVRMEADMRNKSFITVGMFGKPQKVRDRVYDLTKCKDLKEHKAWRLTQNDNEWVALYGDKFYRITRHCLIK